MNNEFLVSIIAIGTVAVSGILYFTGRKGWAAKKKEMNWRAKLCPQYKTRYTMGQESFVMSLRNCSSCRHYVGGRCDKKLLNSARSTNE